MSAFVPAPVRRILEEGALCHVASSTPTGPHVTPMVFALAGGRVWVTTSRSSVKARAWRRDPRVAGLVRFGVRATVFTGTVTTYDLLDAPSWGRSLAQGPLLAVAGLRFTRKNARFFAGYALDAKNIPLGWTPPGRVFAEIRLERSAILELGRIVSAWGDWGNALEDTERFRAIHAGEPVLARMPEAVRDWLGTSGDGALALETPSGPVALPVRWTVDGGGLYAAARSETVALAGSDHDRSIALQIDRDSWWRARTMVGAMIKGEGEVAVIRGLRSGVSSATHIARLADVDASEAALVRLRAASIVWWRGWSSGTVNLG